MRFTMRRLEWLFLLVVSSTMLLSAQTMVEEHWSPYNYPKEIPADMKYHIVAEGDTLWGITATYLEDPLLWPQVYARNAYILDPNLIYPGDPIFLDVGMVITGEAIAQDIEADPDAMAPETGEFTEMDEMADADDPDGMGDEEGQGEEDISNVAEVTTFDSDSAEFVILPAGDRSDMECSTFIYELNEPSEVLPFDFKISGGENKLKTHFGPSDIVYLNKGHNDGIAAGQIYSVRRVISDVRNPENRFLGKAIDQIGKLKILATQGSGATASLMYSCFETEIGDFLVPYEQEPIPLITELPAVDRYAPFEDQGHGYVVFSEDNLASFGKGHLTNIDMGIDKNVAPGDLFIIFKENPSNNPKKGILLPNLFLGHGVALKTGPQSTVMKIIVAVSEIKVGDMVVPINPSTYID